MSKDIVVIDEMAKINDDMFINKTYVKKSFIVSSTPLGDGAFWNEYKAGFVEDIDETITSKKWEKMLDDDVHLLKNDKGGKQNE